MKEKKKPTEIVKKPKTKQPMTKKKKLILIFSIIGAVIIAATAIVLVILLTKKKPEPETKKTPQCVAPEITVLDDGIYWANVANAESYYYNYNAGEWTEANEMIAYPTEAGEYTLQLKAVDGEGKDGKVTEFAFTVAKMTVECERVDNALHFTGERVYFSVNGMEEGALGESNILDFSNDTFGTKYTVQYYAKGGYFSKEDSVYYLDSDKQTQSFTTTQMLTMPTLRVNEAGTHLVWTASENAENYAVNVDGEKATVSTTNPTVAFPTAIGEHVITVQAVGDGDTWYSSLVAEYKMTTKRVAIPTITFDSRTDDVCWDEFYADKMQMSIDGGEYTQVNAASVAAQTNTALKVGAYYSQTEKTYYLESKPVYFEQREVSLPSFSMDGYVKWNDADEALAKKYYVSIVEQAQTAKYTRLNENVKNISFLPAGDYTLSVYASDYVKEEEARTVFYLPSASKEIDFSVLARPALSFEQGKLLWEVDALATSYEYRVDGSGEWETATENGFLRTRDMATYEVRAIGSQTAGRYALTSKASSLFFDPELDVDWDNGKSDLALFDNARYAQTIASANDTKATKTGTVELVTSSTADDAEQTILAGANGGVLKMTAGNAAPLLKAHWGNSDGASVEFFQPLIPKEDAKIILRMYVVPNAARQTVFQYNYTGEFVNTKGRTIDENGNTYAYFDEENNLVGYQSASNTLIDKTGVKIGTINTKTYIATVEATGETTKARIAYGILDDNDNLLGVADENGVVKNGDTTVGTLNANGELVDGSNNVLSTSAVKQTKNLEGQFIISVMGNKLEGGFGEFNTWFDTQEKAIKTGEWTEVSLTITKSMVSVFADIQSVHVHFLANGQEGDTFYIDEVRYDENPQMLEAPAFLADNGEVGPNYYSVREFSDFKPSVTSGTDEYGEYIDFDWGDYQNGWGKDAITFYFDNITLNEGDKVYIRCQAYSGRYTRIDVNNTSATKENGVYDAIINCNDVGGELYQEKLCYTASEQTQLNTLSIRPYAWSVRPDYLIHFRIYGVYVERAA